MRRRLAAFSVTAALVAALPLPGAAQESLTRGQIRGMLDTALQLELLARECGFYMSPEQKIEIARIRRAGGDALGLTEGRIGALRNQLDDMLRQDRDRICFEDERVYRQTLEGLTAK